MLRRLLIALLPLAFACSSTELLDAGTPTAQDAGATTSDATVVDAGTRYDSGIGPVEDAGFSDPATLLEGYESIEGVRTYIRVRGTLTSTLPPIVILNTGPMLGHDYLVEPLDFLLGPGGAQAPNRLLLLYDMRATGRSGFGSIVSPEITIEAHVEDLGYLLQWLDTFAGRTGPVDILAHGYGAAVASIFAVEQPERIRRMIYVTPYPAHVLEQADYGVTINNRLNSGDRERLVQISEWNYCLRDIPQCSRDVWNILGPTWFCENNRHIYNTMDFKYVDIRAWVYYINDDLRNREFDFRPTLDQVIHPVTLITGACDAIPPETAQSYSEHLSNSTHWVFEDSGHFPMTENPARFQRIVTQALSD